MSTKEFKHLMQAIANGWNEGKPAKAVECFTTDAVYMEPPNKQLFKGYAELFEYFGGASAKPGDMKLTWHHIFLDEKNQTGAGEYTFEMNNIIHHGVAVVELENGKIKLWREYDFPGSISREEFLKIEGQKFIFTIKDLKK